MKFSKLAAATLALSILASSAALAEDAMVKGVVKKIDAGAGKITLTSGPIKKLDMDEDNMTMVFRVQDRPACGCAASAVLPRDICQGNSPPAQNDRSGYICRLVTTDHGEAPHLWHGPGISKARQSCGLCDRGSRCAAASTAYVVHCHVPHHVTNNNVEQKGGGGLMLILDVH